MVDGVIEVAEIYAVHMKPRMHEKEPWVWWWQKGEVTIYENDDALSMSAKGKVDVEDDVQMSTHHERSVRQVCLDQKHIEDEGTH